MIIAPLLAVTTLRAPSALPRVKCVGTHFEAAGHPILLQGTNLGGWFLTELWMTPWLSENPKDSSKKIEDDQQLYDLLAKRFGKKGSAEVRHTWRTNWVNGSDFRQIAADGFNFVRLPFRDELIHEPGGMQWLKKAVGWAAANHLYVVLDMHGAPGGQSKDQTTGWGGRGLLWSSKTDQDQFVADWKLLAKTFGSNTTVAMFDLVNEPSGSADPRQAFELQGRALKAIRPIAPHTVVTMEDGFKGFQYAPDPAKSGWKNVCFQPHQYNFDAKDTGAHITALNDAIKEWDVQRARLNAPFYIGEWNVDPYPEPATVLKFTDALRASGYSWSFWTWKVYPAKDSLGGWGINFEPDSGRLACDPFNDSKAEIEAKLMRVQTKSMATNNGMAAAFGLKPRQH